MLEVKDLKKVYQDDSGSFIALDGVSFKMPNKGMVFVVGKSGCGKTTLLNTIGGLDHFTSGDILINGKGLSKFSVVELDNYRNSTVGFIFQDFCLIDRLTVIDNIKLSLEFQNSDKVVNYDELLTTIGLDGLGNRYPKQLSAGQKQRVAIARAIVKDPQIILADEPTGNLDENTSHQLMDLLKEISKDRLVVVISHNPEEAYKYADRILEMSDGKIISDKTINDDYTDVPLIYDDKAILAGNGIITDKDLDILNDKISRSLGNYEVIQSEPKFINKEANVVSEEIDLKEVNMNNKTKLKYALFFFRKKLIFNLFMVLLITIVAAFLSIIEGLGFSKLNEEMLRINNVEGYDNLILNFNDDDYSNLESIDTTIVSQIVEKYNGSFNGVYPINLNFYDMNSSYLSLGFSLNYADVTSGYISQSNGVLVTDTTDISEKVNGGNGIEVLYGKISDNSCGVVITDYLADCILRYDTNFSSYQEIVDAGMLYNALDVDAIVKSNFNEKYKEHIFDYTKDELDNVFTIDVIWKYSICYTTNKNFIENYINYCYENECGFLLYHQFSLRSGKNFLSGKSLATEFDKSLGQDEIKMAKYTYESLFKGMSADDFTPVTITLKIQDTDLNYIIDKEVTIVDLYDPTYEANSIMISDSYYLDYAKTQLSNPLSVIIKNEGQIYDSITELLDNYFVYSYYPTRTVFRTMQLLSVFTEVFMFISIIIIFAIFLIIVLNASTIIRQNVYEIGVMKALGAKTLELVVIFTLQMVITCLCVCILLYFASNMFIRFANDLLCNGISAYIGDTVLLDILTFSFKFFSINISSITVFTIISIMVPILAIRSIKPLKIIKTRN